MPFGRRNPFDEIEELFERMGREFDAREWPGGGSVAVDVADHGDRYVVSVDLPGYARDDIDIRFAAGSLQLAADRETDEADEGVDYLRRERRRKSVNRRVSLPDAVDEDAATATYDAGVLSVELPKQEADGGTRIDVE